MKYTLEEYMSSYLAELKAVEMWFHSAHHVTKGPGFLSDHKSLYGEMYIKIGDHFDLLVEKSIGLTGSEITACPLRLSSGASHILNNHYSSPVEKNSNEIVKDAIRSMSNLIRALTSLHEKLKSSRLLSLGLEDSLATMANEYEGFLYFLGQRYKN